MTTQEIQNLKKLGPDSLRNFVTSSAKNERHQMLRVLYGLQEIERQRLFLQWGFPSLHQFCVEALGYSEGSAARRVQASRLLREVPELKNKLEEGTLSLSVVAQAQSFFYRESKVSEYSIERKREVLQTLDHKTTRETERELLKLSPQALPQERVRQLTADHQELKVILDKDLMQAIEEFKSLSSHQHIDGSHLELIRKAFQIANAALLKKKIGSQEKKSLATEGVSRIDSVPLSASKSDVSSSESSVCPAPSQKRPIHKPAPAREPNAISRFIPTAIKRSIWQRDQGCCAFVDPITKQRCSSKFKLEFDHFPIPFAQGGVSSIENLRIACRLHNVYSAERIFGKYSASPRQKPLSPRQKSP